MKRFPKPKYLGESINYEFGILVLQIKLNAKK